MTDTPFPPGFFESIAERGRPALSHLGYLASDPAEHAPRIAQLERLWNALPSDARNSDDLLSRFRSIDDRHFNGALAEVVTGYVLSQLGTQPEYCTVQGGQTPDWLAHDGGNSYSVEVFSIGAPEADITFGTSYELVARELDGLLSKRTITLVRNQIMRDGNFKGLRERLPRYLAGLPTPIDPMETHALAHKGWRVFFNIYESEIDLPLCTGANSDIMTGDPAAEGILVSVVAKAKKYKFPLVLSCVTFEHSATINSLARALFGPVTDRSREGFWDPRFKSQERQQRILAILFVKAALNGHSDLLDLRSWIVRNPSASTTTILQAIPDPLAQAPNDWTHVDPISWCP